MKQKGDITGNKGIIEKANEEAIKVLSLCANKNGFYAAYPGYKGVWSRDANIISLGASLIDDKKFQRAFKNSLITLAKGQADDGQIPNAVLFNNRGKKNQVDFQSIDSSCWFIIGHYNYKKKFGNELFKKYKKNIERAYTWLSYQETGEDTVLEQLPTTDWQDAFPHRYGHTINTQALWYKVLKLMGNNSEAALLKNKVNSDKDVSLWDNKKDYYISWRWKNHGKYHEKGEWFDSLGNILAIIYGLADKKRAESILRYIKKARVDVPFPVKAITPPIKKGSKDWQDYFLDSEAGKPYQYLNGGIWTFIGGFYVCALVKMKKFEEAKKQLEKLAEANMIKPGFGEWIHGKTGKIGKSHSGSQDGNQGWNAGMYIIAYESVKKRRCLV
jgi:hypothetical protein